MDAFPVPCLLIPSNIVGSKMPRIAFILEAFYGDAIGGAERQVQMLSEALHQWDWDTCYISQRPLDKPSREIYGRMEVIALPPQKHRSAWLNYSALHHAMQSCKADIFYQRVRHPYTGLGVAIARQLGKPLVFAAASIADVTRKSDLRRKNFSGSLVDSLLHPLNRKMEDWGILHANHIILQSMDQLQLLRSDYKREGTIIPNHIRFDQITNEKMACPPQILWISNIKPFKRPELFIALARRCRNLDARFRMIGSCPNRSILQSLVDAETELPHFKYLGSVAPVESEEKIASSAILVNTSEFEGFPNAFQQAWAHGVPTLSLGIDPDGVIQKYGFGVSVKTLDELETALRQYLLDDNLRRSQGDTARQFARKTYDLELLLPRYLEVFNSLLVS
jgi:glycosyltransferase involved in cell wall biosynthesis